MSVKTAKKCNCKALEFAGVLISKDNITCECGYKGYHFHCPNCKKILSLNKLN